MKFTSRMHKCMKKRKSLLIQIQIDEVFMHRLVVV